MTRPSHITLHRHFTSVEDWQPWVVLVRNIREVLPPGLASSEINAGGQVFIAGHDNNVSIEETPEQVAALIDGEVTQ